MPDSATPIPHFKYAVERCGDFINITVFEVNPTTETEKAITILPFLSKKGSGSPCSGFKNIMSNNYALTKSQAERVYEDFIQGAVIKLNEFKAA